MYSLSKPEQHAALQNTEYEYSLFPIDSPPLA